MRYKQTTPTIAKDAFIMDGADVIGDVVLASEVSVWFHATVRGDMAPIIIGKKTNIQDNAVIHTDTALPTNIGKYVTVGHSAIVHAATVGDYALIGMGSIILNGAEIGEEAMVAAGTLVPPGKKVPPRTLALGNPMRIIRELREDEIKANKKNALTYVSLAKDYQDE